MNSERAGSGWHRLLGRIKEQWGKLTNDDLAVIEGQRDQLAGRVQERYGIPREEAERQVREWEQSEGV